MTGPSRLSLARLASACLASACLIWAALLLAAPPAGAQVALSEVMWNPTGSEHHDEFVELVNLSDTTRVSLSGWRLGDGDELDALIDAGDGLSLAPGACALVLDGSYWGASTTYDSLRGRTFMLTIEDRAFGRAGWSNSSPEAVILCDPAGDTVDVFEYDPVPLSGLSWERIDMRPDAGRSGWQLSATAGGTPGEPNSVQIQASRERARLEIGPDPFGESLDVVVHLPAAQGVVTLRAYDAEGRMVRRLLTAEASTRRRDLTWDGRDDSGQPVLPGLYVLVLEASAEGRSWRVRRVVARQSPR